MSTCTTHKQHTNQDDCFTTHKKRKCANHDENDNGREQSSYAKMKLKMKNGQHELGQLRMLLMETQQQKAELGAALERVRKEQDETNRKKRGSSKGGQTSYAKKKMEMIRICETLSLVQNELQDTQRMKSVFADELVKVRMDLVEVRIELEGTQQRECDLKSVVHVMRTELQELTIKNEALITVMKDEIKELKRGMGLRWLHMEKLKATITEGCVRYEDMAATVEQLQQLQHTNEQRKVAKCRDTRRAVCRAFGWSLKNVDPVYLRVACGFWDATALEAGNNVRTGLKMREAIWYQVTCLGFKGKVLEKMEKGWRNINKFDVVELARQGDVDSRFNSVSLSAIAHSQSGLKKYERGLLCSGATLRRTQKLVLKLAASVGFASFPKHEDGNVWCWGDDKGDFETGVNRYVYEIYVKARSPLVTKKCPWIVPLTGDLARVSTRGKAITMCGPKQSDPRLPCQHGTGKTSNQSRNLYTPAVAGFVDEAHLMQYFDRMVACFKDIEERGYCVVNNVRHEVFIDVIVMADMSYLHKYLKRGGGSHSCTHFCFLCSLSSKYRQEGYPGGCLKCRHKDIVYDKITGTQQCHHHDVCDKEFLEWESMRVAYLEANVKPRIPKSAKPYYENFASLMEQCLLRCRTPVEVAQVSKKKTLASLETWLLAGGRTREGCDLSCNIHTGVKICPITLVLEDLHLRSVDITGLTELQQRTTLEMLLREEEEYLKLQIYLRDNRFRNLLNDTDHRSQLHKTILDMLHCPMRTNEKVLTLLYEEIMNGAHKAQTKEPLEKLTEVIRSVGDLSESWGHKFEDNNTKVLKKFKLPLDQSRKIFAVHQLSRLREAVYIAVPASEPTKRTEWMSFLYHYVHVNEKLHSTLEYGAEDVDDLEEHIDKMYTLLISSIGGKERGITNYFHYLGAGHLIWMVRRFGNLWRFCNEGAESLNSVASKRYNMHNNKGGYKGTSGYKADEEDKTANKCEPFEVLGSWLSRLSMWHLGMAHTMFAEISTKDIIWCPVTSTYTGSTEYESDDDNDLDWTTSCEDDSGSASEEDDDCTGTAEGYESEDLTWCVNARTLDTWDHTTVLHGKRSNRKKFQQGPVFL